jgi:hypothetical protein
MKINMMPNKEAYTAIRYDLNNLHKTSPQAQLTAFSLTITQETVNLL